MLAEFTELSPEEREIMYNVPALVFILIAGADNVIDNAEFQNAINLSRIRQRKARENLTNYYQEAGNNFENKVREMIRRYPSDAAERNPLIIAELEMVNDILPKLDHRFAIEFYVSIRDLAKKIADTSGGFLGYLAVGYEESKLIELEMIKDPGRIA